MNMDMMIVNMETGPPGTHGPKETVRSDNSKKEVNCK